MYLQGLSLELNCMRATKEFLYAELSQDIADNRKLKIIERLKLEIEKELQLLDIFKDEMPQRYGFISPTFTLKNK